MVFRRFLVALFLLLPISDLQGGHPPPESHRVRALMGTVFEIRVWDNDEPRVSSAVTAAFDEVARLENVFSLYRPDSDLSRFNSSPVGRSVAVGPDIFGLAVRSLRHHRDTNGAFDPTLEPLTRYWRSEVGWTTSEWRRSAREVGVGFFRMNEDQKLITRLRPGAGLNFDGIAKGTALDAAAEVLRKAGVKSFRFNFGGQILSENAPLKEAVEIADPRSGRTLARFLLGDGSVSTSSQHERFVAINGEKHGHVIDPRTKRVLKRTGFVTVLAPTAEEADALSTALLVLGRKNGAAVIHSRYPQAAALFIDEARGRWELTPTANFPDSLEIVSGDAQRARP